jgi:pullulanase
MRQLDITIASAYWLAPGSICVLLDKNWDLETLPTFKLNDPSLSSKLCRVRRMPSSDLAQYTMYQDKGSSIQFQLDPKKYPHLNFHCDSVSVVGTFNNWGHDSEHAVGIGTAGFELSSVAPHNPEALFKIELDKSTLGLNENALEFKFKTQSGYWVNPITSAPNLSRDTDGNVNYVFTAKASGSHAFLLNLDQERGMDRPVSIALEGTDFTPIQPGLTFFDLKTQLPLGAIIEPNDSTTFRLFAPRAASVAVETQMFLDQAPTRYALKLSHDQLTWELNLKQNLTGFFYSFFVDGHNDSKSTLFNSQIPLLDPYAKATVGPKGPGIIIDSNSEPTHESPTRFHPPHWHDLSILECHVRDLTEGIKGLSRKGFKGISEYLDSNDNYLSTIGANAIELLPIQQFDSLDAESYHWGYMTNNYFSPCRWYASSSEALDQNDTFKEMVDQFHNKGKALILDVVYNHVGEPAHLAHVDKAYYFHLTEDGHFENWSGCGNTLNCSSAMTKRLIIDSLSHLIRHYDVDGFRFDLAELIEVPVLKEIASALKAIKPSVILIAEPWSFRGEIKRDLRLAGFMFWNDAFREFSKDYVLGHSDIGSLAYFIRGSTQYLAAWPSQSVNYIESHDDRCWIDKITENENYDGSEPTEMDIKRTHLAAALMYCSLGTPMLASGVDFLKSKYGFQNSYQRGDLNALDYLKIADRRTTHNYFKSWIQFRQSGWGDCLRLNEIPSDTYVRVFRSENTHHSSAVIQFNADLSNGSKQVMLMLNPHLEESVLPLGNPLEKDWKSIATIDSFDFSGIEVPIPQDSHNKIYLAPMSLVLCVRPAWNG